MGRCTWAWLDFMLCCNGPVLSGLSARSVGGVGIGPQQHAHREDWDSGSCALAGPMGSTRFPENQAPCWRHPGSAAHLLRQCLRVLHPVVCTHLPGANTVLRISNHSQL